jgi:hypothetical protein
MPLQITRTQPTTALPIFAQLYGCSEQDFRVPIMQMTDLWLVQNAEQEVLGVLGLRPSPAHGAELMGGAFPGPNQHEAAQALLQAAVSAQPRLYGYAESDFLPEAALAAAGLHSVSAYTRMVGSLPELSPAVPEGFSIVPLKQVHDVGDRLIAQRTYSHRIGHTPVPDEAAQPDFAGTDDRLSRVAYSVNGVSVGICRVALTETQAALGTPGVALTVQRSGLRRALLLSALEAARSAGATQVVLEGWGDTVMEREEDEALGLTVEAVTPIYSSVPLT